MTRLLVLFLLLFTTIARAEPVTIKLATLAPQGSTWERALRELGTRWATITNGEVQLRIYAGGVAGNEGTMVRKLRIGQLQAASLTNVGLHDLDPAASVMQTPMLIRSDAELEYVLTRIAPELETRMQQSGVVVLNWSEIGWVRLFSAQPLLEPGDAGKHKTWVWSGDPGAVKLFTSAGFRPVVLDSTDVLPALQSGLLDAFPNPPLSALGMQWFALAPHMLDLPWAPLIGATVISDEAWQRIPAQYHAPMLAAAAEVGASIRDDVRAQETKSIAVMQRYGLTVHAADTALRARWYERATQIFPTVRGGMVPVEVFDRVQQLLEEYRHGQG